MAVVVVRELVLGFGGLYTGYDSVGIGLRGYGLDGKERFHALGSKWINWVEAAWPYAYVPHQDDETKVDVVDLRDGGHVTTVSVDGYVSVVGR